MRIVILNCLALHENNMQKTIKIIGWSLAIIIVLFLLGYLYSAFFKPMRGATNVIGMLVIGLLLGGIIAFLISKLLGGNKSGQRVVESSHTVVESMRRVFKVVCAEGQFHEIYNYEDTKKLLKFIPSTKKALVVVQAKVMIGFDFEKCLWKADEEAQKITILSFPQPEILSLEPEYKYYYFEEDLFNLIGREDLHRIQEMGKKQVQEAALNSGLIQIAADQMRTMLSEILQANHWQLDNPNAIKALPVFVPKKEGETTPHTHA